MSEDDQDSSRRYWKAAISALPTAEKRDAAWEFYLDKFAGTSAGDTFSGLILLMEANGAFLLTLPEKFYQEMSRPILERLKALRDEIDAIVESQRTALLAADAATEGLEKGNKQLVATGDIFASKIHGAARLIDTNAVANRVHEQLESLLISPLRLALSTLPAESRQIEAASKAARASIEKWHKLNFGVLLALCAAFAIVIALALAGFVYRECHEFYDRRLTAEIVRLTADNEACRRLLALGVGMRLDPWTDANGKPVEDAYALVITKADDAQIKESDGHKEAVILVKRDTLQEQLDDIAKNLREFEKLQHPKKAPHRH